LNSPDSTARQPAYIKLVNRLGRGLVKAGLRLPALSDDRLLDSARRRTGCNDFGDDSFRSGLARLTAELEDHAQLSQVGRLAAHFNLVENLCVRLQLVNYRARHPDIARQSIHQPLFITGLPRTGTTILFELIAQDPAVRSPASWEVAKPVPPPRYESYQRDRRIKSVDRFMGQLETLSPGFQAVHAIGARLPQECVYIFASQFASEQFGYMFDIPRYRAWLLEQDMTTTYRWHAHFLQHLQAGFARERWVLKTPSHIGHLRYLLAQYPDAAIVWTHRRPLDAMASFSSLASRLQSAFGERMEPHAVGTHEFTHFASIVRAGIEQRRGLGEQRFFDASFSAICADPIAVVGDIYAHFGIPFSRDAHTRMRDYLRHHPRHQYGRHDYRAADFGLDATREESLYADYLSRFGAYLD